MSPRQIRIAPSLLAADFARLGEEARAVAEAGADWLHLDIMDGHFVPNISFGPVVVRALRRHVAIPLDVHLMIAPADPYLEAFAAAGADCISVHPEAGPHLHRTLQTIRGLGKRAGVVLNPATPVAALDHVLDLCDLVLVMAVNPGFGGQAFLASQLEKIATLRHRIDATGRDIALQVDGGITAATAPACIAAGADVLVAGTAVFGATDYYRAIASLRSSAGDGTRSSTGDGTRSSAGDGTRSSAHDSTRSSTAASVLGNVGATAGSGVGDSTRSATEASVPGNAGAGVPIGAGSPGAA